MQADEQGAVLLPSPHFFANRNGQKPRFVIVHGTASPGSAEAIGKYFQGSVQSAVHYIVGQDGTIVQSVEEKDGAWGNGGITGDAGTGGDGIHHDFWWSEIYKNSDGSPINPNLITISIEHVKPNQDNSDQLTPAQQQASFRLIYDICVRNSIPMKLAQQDGGITGHFSMDPVNRSRCPGPYPWNQLISYLEKGHMLDISNPTVAQYFKQTSETHWTCTSNGKVIADAILNYYRTVGGPLAGLGAYRLPLTDEFYPKPGVSMQRFEGGVLVWDPHRSYDNPSFEGDVYPARIYDGVAADPRVQTLTAQYADASSSLANALAQIKTLQDQYTALKNTIDESDPLIQHIVSGLTELRPYIDKLTVSSAPTASMPVVQKAA